MKAVTYLTGATPPQVVIGKIGKEGARILELPDVKEQMLGQGEEASPSSPDEFAMFVRAKVETARNVATLAGIRVKNTDDHGQIRVARRGTSDNGRGAREEDPSRARNTVSLRTRCAVRHFIFRACDYSDGHEPDSTLIVHLIFRANLVTREIATRAQMVLRANATPFVG
jgi:hypothetical protein